MRNANEIAPQHVRPFAGTDPSSASLTIVSPRGHSIPPSALNSVLPVLVAAIGIVSVAGTTPAAASPQSRARTHQGFALAYDLQLSAGYDAFAEATRADATDPAPHRAVAAITWMEILFAQGVATFDAFSGELTTSDVKRPTAPPLLVERYQRSISEAMRLAEQRLTTVGDADAHYQVGATAALSALYRATVEGRTVGVFTEARRAVHEIERARALDPTMKETALVLGMSQYTISTMPWPVRTLAQLSGLSGDRRRGLRLLHEAATPGTETEADALLLLMLVDHRENRPVDAVKRLAHLHRAYPGNRLLALNLAASDLAAKNPLPADALLSAVISHAGYAASPVVLGEAALWFALRGTARIALKRQDEAVADLESGLALMPRDWVRGRMLRRLGDVALGKGQLEAARRQFSAAAYYSERGGDPAAAKSARQALDGVHE